MPHIDEERVPVQLPFPGIDWKHYQVTYQPLRLLMLTAPDLILEAEKDIYVESYIITIGRENEQAQCLWIPDTRQLGIAWKGVTHWQTVNTVEEGIQRYTCPYVGTEEEKLWHTLKN